MDDEDINEVLRVLNWIAVGVEIVAIVCVVTLAILVALWICK